MSEPIPSVSGHPPRLTIQAEARAWARKLAVGRPTAQDAETLKQWCAQSPEHNQAWQQASAEWKALGEVMQSYRARNPIPVPAVQRPSRRRFLGAAIGSAATAMAVVAVVRPPLGLWPSWSELGADYRTVTGEQRDVQIGAHIRVALNTQTSIVVKGGNDHSRIELIAGEAAVLSDGGQTLEIVAGAGRVQMATGCVELRQLGAGRVRLACTEGQAQLLHPAQSLALRAGEQVVYDVRTVSGLAAYIGNTNSAWRDGIVDFDHTPLPLAVAEINRYRPGRVVLINDALAQHRISGRFKVDALNQAITLIEHLYQAKVRRFGDVVLLS